MIRRTTSFLWRALTTAIVGILVLVGLAAWRLSLGPVDLDFLRPYASRSFDSPQGPIRFAADRISLSWEVGEGPMRLQFDEVRAVDTSGATIARVPAVTVDLNAARLLTGSLAPTSIVVDKVALDVVIDQSGLMSMLLPSSESDPSARFLPILIEQLLKEPNDRDAFGRLNEVRISAAHLRIQDSASGFVWRAPASGAVLLRDEVGVLVRARTQLQADDQIATIDFNGVYSRDRERISARLSVENLRPALFAHAAPELGLLALLELPMNGKLEFEASGNGTIRTIALDLQGGTGRVTIPGVFPEPKAVDRVVLKAMAFPARRELRLERFDVDFGGPTAGLTGVVTDREGGYTVSGVAELRDIGIARLAEFWPPPFAPGGRAWTLDNVREGHLDRAMLTFAARGRYDSIDRLEVERIEATLAYRGLTIRYMPGMIPVKGVAGTARFDGKVLRFEAHGGSAGQVQAPKARIDLLGLDGNGPHRADIAVDLAASAPVAMEFLEQPRLAIPRDVLFNPRRLGGDVQMRLEIAFPLVNDLALEQVKYTATALLKRFSLQRAIGELNLTEGDAVLTVDARSLSVKGRGKVEGQSFDIAWQESFDPRVNPRRRYEVRGAMPLAMLARFGVAIPEKYADGAVTMEASYATSNRGQSELNAQLGLGPARLALPELHWEKKPGEDGKATLSIKFAGANPTSIDIDATAAGLAAKARIELRASDAAWQQITVSRLTLGRTDAALTVRRAGEALQVDLKARALDLALLRNERPSASTPTPGPAASGQAAIPLILTVDIERVLSRHGQVGPLRGSLRLRGERIEAADLRLGSGTSLRVTPANASRRISIASDDLGGLLRSVGWLDGVVGGQLEIEGVSEDAKPGAPVHATVVVKNYRLARVPAGRPVSDLNGVIEGLERLGDPLLPFALLEMRVQKTGERIEVRRARTNNGSIGLAIGGRIDLGDESLRLEGTGVPAYEINSLLSNVPILGPIVTGGQGKGVFSVNFAIGGTIEAPKVSVNAASMLAPGILRELFGAGPADEEKSGERGPSSEPVNSGKTP